MKNITFVLFLLSIGVTITSCENKKEEPEKVSEQAESLNSHKTTYVTDTASQQSETVMSVELQESVSLTDEERESEPKDDDIINSQAYEAYLSLLVGKKNAIEAYNWQKSDSVTGADMTHPVVLRDCYGDETPELIYLSKNESNGYMAASLNIVTFEDDQIRELYSNQYWDSEVASGNYYYLYQHKDDKTLYTFTSTGDESWHEYYGVFKLENNEMTYVDLLEHTERPDFDHFSVTTGPEYIHFYLENGTRTITEQEYEDKVRNIENNTASVLMYSDMFGGSNKAVNFVKDFVDQNGCLEMTCEEAINYLKGLLKTNGSSETAIDNVEPWFQAYKSFVLEGEFLNSGNTDLGYGDLETGFAVVGFAIHDMNDDSTPELIINNGFNGRDLRSNYIFTYSDADVVYCGCTGADIYAVEDYPGLFSGVTETGWYLDEEYVGKYSEVSILNYLYVENNNLVKKKISVIGYPVAVSSRQTIFQTENPELLEASERTMADIKTFTWAQLQESGWDGLVESYLE
ncbi:MAG: hypothetical protein J6N21_13590 [Butyrivibrio sp.]|nr:hypothetical protein [Butyrivibrio sp.]